MGRDGGMTSQDRRKQRMTKEAGVIPEKAEKAWTAEDGCWMQE